MIACGEQTGPRFFLCGLRFFHASPKIVQKLVPLYGAGDVDLITGTETSPNITQSETFTTANPDNPNRSSSPTTTHAAATPIPSTSPAHRSPPTAAPPSPASPTPAVKAPLPIPWATLLFCITSQPALGLRSGWMWPAAVRASAATSPPLHRIRIAGPISAFSTSARTTGNLAGLITTQPLPSLGACTFPGTTSMSARGALFVIYSTDGGATWHAPYSDQRRSFIRNVQITGDLSGNGDVYIAGMDEGGGGFPHNEHQPHLQVHRRRQHLDQHLHRPSFPGPGVTAVGLLRLHVSRCRRLLAARGLG